MLRRMLLEPEKKRTDYTDYQVPTKKMKYQGGTYFNEKSKVTILTYIHTISYKYEYFGSGRTPVTNSRMVVHETTPHPCFAPYKIEVSYSACIDEFR